MLVQLAIRDIVLIERLDLAFGGGLSALTGETGAGKSILLDSLSLALGARGDGALVRQGQTQGQVTAVFDLPPDHPARAAAAAHDLLVEGDLILKRVQLADGRTRASVNDQPVSAQALRAIGAGLVELHGQHDDRALVDPASHRALLDHFGGHLRLRDQTREAHRRLVDSIAARDAQAAESAAAERERDYLRHAAEELERLAPEPGEEERLAARRQTMMHGEKLRQEIASAAEAIGGPSSPIPTLAAAMRRLQRREQQAPELIAEPVKALDAAIAALDEAREALERSLRACDFDPRDLERAEERLFALRAAARKYACAPDELLARAQTFRGDLARIESGARALEALEKGVAEAEAAYHAAAKALSEARRKAAAKLDKAVRAELAPLKLERASFTTNVASDATLCSADGYDRVEFWVQTNPGSRPGPLIKVASGGELARFLLALKVVIADRGSAPTLVFDEIDTGVGGAVADAIGQRLKRLAGSVQVLCVTHAPQVAAQAQRHFLIVKEGVAKGQRVTTRVSALDETTRREEIARMLAGATITDEARAAAGRLLGANAG